MTCHDGAAWLVWGLHDLGPDTALGWMPRSQDVWVGAAAKSANCTHDLSRLMQGDISQWAGLVLPHGLPDALWQRLELRLEAVYVMFDRTEWGRESSFTERRNMAALIARCFYGLVMSRQWRFAFFAAPPHFGFDEILKEILVWAEVPVVYALQSLFPGRFWLLSHRYELLAPKFALPTLPMPVVDSEVLFYMTNFSVKTYGWYRIPLIWLKFLVGWGRSRHQPYYEIKRVLRQRRFQYDTANVFPRARQVTANELRQHSSPFVFFPLHLQPEMTTSALGGALYDDQARVLEDLLQNLPDGWTILLKENPKQDWRQRSTDFFLRCAADPRVFMLDRRINSKEVIKRCRVVATVSGTAGWEAVRMGKPVVIFGHAWYAGFSGIHRWSKQLSLDSLPLPEQQALADDFKSRMALTFSGVVDEGYAALGASEARQQLYQILKALPIKPSLIKI